MKIKLKKKKLCRALLTQDINAIEYFMSEGFGAF